MPLKNGKLTRSEMLAAKAYAETGQQKAAILASGLSQPGTSLALQRPAVQAEIVRQQQAILVNELLPLAIVAHRELLTNPATPAGARVQAVKLAYDRVFGDDEKAKAKAPEEMSPEEIARLIDELERQASSQAKPVRMPDPGGIFD